jgi:sugar O-acyltransferase (sialic acid O-acetyltransferase NeuD family)
MKIIGDGGHAKVVRSVIRALRLSLGDEWAFIAVGNSAGRKKEALIATAAGYRFPTLIHPKATVDETARIGEGTIIMAGVVVQADTVIGKHCILNTCCSVDHDCKVGDYAHIAPGAHLCGGVTVGEGTLVGVGSRAIPGAVIGAWGLVRAGETAR